MLSCWEDHPLSRQTGPRFDSIFNLRGPAASLISEGAIHAAPIRSIVRRLCRGNFSTLIRGSTRIGSF